MNLIEAFAVANPGHGALSRALTRMNQALGSHYDLARLGQWRRGEVPVPSGVQQYMRGVILDWYHHHRRSARITRALIDEIRAMLDPPPPKPEPPTRRDVYYRWLGDQPNDQG